MPCLGETSALLTALIAYALHLYRARGFHLSPDGRRYAAMALGEREHAPFSRRWLLPVMCKTMRAWAIVNAVAFVAAALLFYELSGSLAATWMLVWLPMMATNVRFPVLTDGVAFALALLTALLWHGGYTGAAMVTCLVAGQVKEPGAAFGALLCWSPAMGVVGACSIGLAVALGRMFSRDDKPTEEFLLHPVRTAMRAHDPLSWQRMVLPWGSVAVVAAMQMNAFEWSSSTAMAAVALVLGYGQLIIANDESRLYQWAAPAVLMALPMEGPWLPLLLVAHPFLCAAGSKKA